MCLVDQEGVCWGRGLQLIKYGGPCLMQDILQDLAKIFNRMQKSWGACSSMLPRNLKGACPSMLPNIFKRSHQIPGVSLSVLLVFLHGLVVQEGVCLGRGLGALLDAGHLARSCEALQQDAEISAGG